MTLSGSIMRLYRIVDINKDNINMGSFIKPFISIFLGLFVFAVSAHENKMNIPNCLLGVCLTDEPVREAVIFDKFGVGEKQVRIKDMSYCYVFSDKDNKIYGRFTFKDLLGEGVQLTTIQASTSLLCDSHKNFSGSIRDLSELGMREKDIEKAYGKPHYLLAPPSSAEISDFFGDHVLCIDRLYLYVPNEIELFSSRFFLSNGIVVGRDVSMDE